MPVSFTSLGQAPGLRRALLDRRVGNDHVAHGFADIQASVADIAKNADQTPVLPLVE